MEERRSVDLTTHPYLDGPLPIAFAHQGGASEHPENTMPAFDNAYQLGYRYMETDVHASSDGVLFAFHDPDLQRTCGRPGIIRELSAAEVATARVSGREPIPRLDELLSAWPDAKFNIDCKSDHALPYLLARLDRDDLFDRVCIGSFSDARLDAVRERYGAKVCTSMGPRDVTKVRLGTWLRRTPRFSGAAVPLAAQVPVKQGPLPIVTPSFVDGAHAAGLQVHVWTIDDPAMMNHLLDLGVDGIMTDRVTTLREVMQTRALWR
ncbi:MAG: glycerophosphodiester phosphodiesterase [Actinomycetota bacterium]